MNKPYIRTRPIYQGQYIRLGHTSSRRLQDVFKRSSRRLAMTSSIRLAKTSSRDLQGRLAKMSSRRFQDVLSG